MARPMLLCCALCIIIAVIGFYSKTMLLAVGTALAIFTVVVYKRLRPEIIFIMLLCIFMVLSTFYSIFKIEKQNRLSGEVCKAKLVVCDIEEEKQEYSRAVMQVLESEKLPRNAKLYTFYSGTKLKKGDIITSEVKLKSIEKELQKINYSKGIYLTATLENTSVCKGQTDIVIKTAEAVRGYIAKIFFSKLDYPQAATLSALLFGERGYFTEEFSSKVIRAGAQHIMVVSGMHLAILVSFFSRFCDKFYYNRLIKALIILFIVLLLTVLCGFTMSILRAGITYVIFAASLFLKRKNTPENSLCAAGVIILITSPFAVFSIALELSFLATFGILAFAIPITQHLKEGGVIKSELGLEFVSAICACLFATLFTLPVSSAVFGVVSTVSIVTTLLVSFAVEAVIILCIAALFLNLILPVAATPLFYVCNAILKYINNVIVYFGDMPFSSVKTSAVLDFAVILLILLCFKLLLACKEKKNMIKSKEKVKKMKKEGGKRLKWR